MAQTTFYPDECVYIYDFQPDSNFDGETLTLRFIPSDKDPAKIARPLIRQDISSLAGATIHDTSKLRLYCSEVFTNQGAAYVYRLTQTGWTEAGVTWNKYDGVNAWGTPGGDYSTPSVPFSTPAASGWLEIAGSSPNYLSVLLQDALDNRGGAVEMILKLAIESGDSEKGCSFHAEEHFYPPELVIDYTPGAVSTKNYYLGGLANARRLTRGIGF